MTTSDNSVQIKISNLIAPEFHDLHKTIKIETPNEIWCKGGRGSTKSSFISIQIFIGLYRDTNAHAFVARRYDNELRDSVYGQMQWAADKLNLNEKWKFYRNPMQAINLETGQHIVFRGMDNPLKAKSINLGFGYIKFFWAEECDQFGGVEDIRNILQSVFRGENASNQIAYFSFNPPRSARSWVNTETKIIKPGRVVHHSDYRTVPVAWLGERFIADAEHLKITNHESYKHEYLGEEIGTGLEIFNNVVLRSIDDSEIAQFDHIRQGLDFGYAIDPLAFIRFNYNRKKRTIHIFREVVLLGTGNRAFANLLTPDELRELTYADSAEPKSIDELKFEYSMSIRGASKPPGSRAFGMKFLMELESIVIDPARCPHAAKEFVNYAYELTRAGDIVSKYPDKDDHSIDAVRYGLCNDIKNVNIPNKNLREAAMI